jgi:hydroxyacylglutathione hydrolase
MLKLAQIPMRQDNYSYALVKNSQAIVIDPSEPHETARYFEINPHLQVVAVINTHSHIDHIAGNEILQKTFQCPIYGPALERERIPHLTHPVGDRDEISLLGMKITAHDVKAHTVGHTAFLVHEKIDEVIKMGHGKTPYSAKSLNHHQVMFVGDSLFAAGCGRLFEGTKQNLLDCLSFYNRQDASTLMACAHEYTKANLAFAKTIFPNNEAILQRDQMIDGLLNDEGSSVPCLFGLEQKTNPFLLALSEPHRSLLANKFGLNSEDLVSIVGMLRKAKDDF